MSVHRARLPRRTTVWIAGLALTVTGTVATAAPAVAAPPSDRAPCRTVRPQPDFYEGGRVASELLTVPASSRCTTITVRNISDPRNPDDHCATFLLGYFPAEGESEYTEPVLACSDGPTGAEVVLDTAVPDGMPYRVLNEIDYLGQTMRYVIRH
ncbi:hypothetical protein AB0M36_32600 [Actinoplanes sp. NPDC051346]|uniref:hypothetical protein n=1 Tax=Actinoplanes sp. NPDC051346 TaxID=3155048 RepID=UPI003436CF5E